ncbi:MAG: methyltransferase domain-containing protein [Ilumatobacteraceae bacterium]
MTDRPDRYSHGHHESVLRSHRWRTAENSAAFLMPYLRDGVSLLDVGCGPGSITADLARRIPSGQVVGIDLPHDVIGAAQREFGAANLRYEVGDVYALQFDAGSFDLVFAHQVLQHLGDPVAALREMRRVLRPGGHVAVRDSDYGAFVWSPPDPRLSRWMEIYHRLTERNGAEADAGRYLHRWVRTADFEQLQVSSSNWTFQSAEDRTWWGGLWSDRVRESEYARQSVEYGLTNRAELEGIAEAFLEWAADPDALFIVVHGEVIATKPLG